MRIQRTAALSFLLMMIIGSVGHLLTFSSNASFDPTDKIESSLLMALNPDETVDVLVGHDTEATDYKVRAAISMSDSAAQVIETFQDLNMIRVKMLGSAVLELARSDLITRIWSNSVKNISATISPTLSKAPADEHISPVDLIGARGLWEEGYNGTGIVIAVLDTGVDFTHPDLDDIDDDNDTLDSKVTAFASFVEADTLPIDIIGHGTYSASVAAGTGNVSAGLYSGIAPGATVLAGKVTLGGLFAAPGWIVSGIEWAISHGADIILMPFNTFGAPGDAVEVAVQEVSKRGVLVIAAAGDDGPDYLTIMSPGGSPACLTVGAYDVAQQEVPAFSGRGPSLGLMTKPDIVAPGVSIVGAKLFGELSDSTSFGGFDLSGFGSFSVGDIGSGLGDIGDLSGLLGGSLGEDWVDGYIIADTTAAAASITAGAAAILLQAFDRATPIVISNVIRDTATPLSYGANDAGAGLLNLEVAFEYLSARQTPIEPYNRTTGLPLLAFGFLNADARDASTTLMMSSFGTSIIALDTRGNEETTTHLLMGMFSLQWNNEDPTNLMMFDVKRELHQVVLADQLSNYNRWLGIVSVEDTLYVTLLIEAYNFSLSSPDPLTAFKITPFILNLGDTPVANVSLYLQYSLDLFSDGRDDFGKYSIDNDQLFVYSISEDYRNYYFGLNSSRKMDAFEVGNSSDISDHVSKDNLTGSTTFDGNVGLGMKWDFGILQPNIPENITISMGFGENRTMLDASINVMWQSEPSLQFAQQGDLIVVEADLPRTAEADKNYVSRAVVMNIGVEPSQAIGGMIISQGEADSGVLFGNYFNIDEIKPFEAKVLTAEWSPENKGLHTVAWFMSTGLDFLTQLLINPTALIATQGVGVLDDFLLRDLFVVTPIPSASVFPKVLPFAPFDVRFPADFGLYTFTLQSTIELGNLTVSKHGNATDWGNVTLNQADTVYGYYNFSLFILAPPITVDGYHYCDYVINTELGWTSNITLERVLEYPRGMYLLDTSHGGGFSFGADLGGDTAGFDLGGEMGGEFDFPLAQESENESSSNGDDLFSDFDIGELDDLESISDLMEEFRLTTFSGLSNLKKTMADVGLDLVETPGLALDPDLLIQFAGVFMFSPTEEFNSTDIEILRNYTSSGGKLIIFGDYEDRTNHTALNPLLLEYGYLLHGKHDAENTTEIILDSKLGAGLDSVWLGGGTYILNNQSNACVEVNGLPVVLLDDTKPEITLFGSSRIFMNKNLVKNNNTILLDNLNDYLLENTLTTFANLSSPTSLFPAGKSVYLNLYVRDNDGEPVDDLFIAIAFELPNGSLSFFIAGFVVDGLYSSQFIPTYWNDEGRINGIFIIIDEQYANTYSSVSFFLYLPEQTTPTAPIIPFITMLQAALLSSVGIFSALILGLIVNRRRRKQKYRIPELDTELVMDIDNTFNMLMALFRQIELLIEREDMDRIEKVEALRGLMETLDRAREQFGEVSDEVGGV